MTNNRSGLKSPTGIYILAFLFLLAPLGNIFFSFAGSGIEHWYYPETFFPLLSTIPATDWVWLVGIFVAGLALLKRHKVSWLFAVAVLFAVLLMNSYRAFTLDESMMSAEYIRVQILISILVTFSVLIIAFYARHPYLDRRQQWLKQTDVRHSLVTPVAVLLNSGAVPAMTTSLSTSGARIEFPEGIQKLTVGSQVVIVIQELQSLKIQSEVTESSQKVLHLKFVNFGWDERAQFEAWLKSRKA